MSSSVYIKNQLQSLPCELPFLKISITNISPDAESREEQDGTNHFVVRPTMIELWPILCKDANENGKERLLLFL